MIEITGGYVDNRTEAERRRSAEMYAELQLWERGCPACGSSFVYTGRNERGDVSITCGSCSWQVRFDAETQA